MGINVPLANNAAGTAGNVFGVSHVNTTILAKIVEECAQVTVQCLDQNRQSASRSGPFVPRLLKSIPKQSFHHETALRCNVCQRLPQWSNLIVSDISDSAILQQATSERLTV